jgi:hypothetical protein
MYTTRNRVVAGSRKILALGVLLAATLVAVSPAQASTTFTVINTDDSGVGSLRQAMFNANVTPGADVIDFNIAGSGVKTITPTTALPKITGPVTINGYSQPGAEPNTKAVGSDALLKVEISGFGGGAGLVITGSNSTIKGLVINRSGSGIRIDGPTATGNRVVGNYLGTDVSGTQDLGNDAYGLTVDGANNTIGGEATAARNVISGNDRLGILFEDTGGGGNEVVGNYVGTDKNGTAPLGNSSFGIAIDDINNNTIGGTTAAERNVISGNVGGGVSIYGSGNRVMGNYVGTDATGTKGMGNYHAGVEIYGANNVVGGVTAGERNVISDTDAGSGVVIEGADATGNRVAGNDIGTDKNGTAPLGSYEGVYIETAPNNTIGGATAGARNVISGNLTGVSIYGPAATGNRVLSNSIFSNAGLGIDLGADGTTANDPGDPDTGPNNLQNKPVISSAKKGATGTTTVRGKLNSTPGKTFTVQFFSNPEGTDEGKTLLGSESVKTDGTGNFSFVFSTKKVIRLGQNITATATGADGTSEFSAPRKVVAQ